MKSRSWATSIGVLTSISKSSMGNITYFFLSITFPYSSFFLSFSLSLFFSSCFSFPSTLFLVLSVFLSCYFLPHISSFKLVRFSPASTTSSSSASTTSSSGASTPPTPPSASHASYLLCSSDSVLRYVLYKDLGQLYNPNPDSWFLPGFEPVPSSFHLDFWPLDPRSMSTLVPEQKMWGHLGGPQRVVRVFIPVLRMTKSFGSVALKTTERRERKRRMRGVRRFGCSMVDLWRNEKLHPTINVVGQKKEREKEEKNRREKEEEKKRE